MTDQVAVKGAVVVTGGASGMGAAHAKRLSLAGYHVCIVDIDSDDSTAEDIRATGGTASHHDVDISNPSDWQGLADVLVALPWALKGLVNNAAVPNRATIMETTDDEWQRVLATNLSGAFYGIRTLAPLMYKARGGSIVNVSSIAGQTGYFAAAYAACKWGMRGLTKTAAGEFGAMGVRVNTIMPGVIQTPFLETGGRELIDAYLGAVPLGRPGQAEEIAFLVQFLLSAESSYLTGSEIAVDGGMASSGLFWRIRGDVDSQLAGRSVASATERSRS